MKKFAVAASALWCPSAEQQPYVNALVYALFRKGPQLVEIGPATARRDAIGPLSGGCHE